MAMMNDPSVMMNMMQGNFAMMVPQMVMMGTPRTLTLTLTLTLALALLAS